MIINRREFIKKTLALTPVAVCAAPLLAQERPRRFEDLMRHGFILLRTKRFHAAVFTKHLSTQCRGWLFTEATWADFGDHWRAMLRFEKANDLRVLDGSAVKSVKISEATWEVEQKWAFRVYEETDFDAMLSALEPYKIVMPGDCPSCGVAMGNVHKSTCAEQPLIRYLST